MAVKPKAGQKAEQKPDPKTPDLKSPQLAVRNAALQLITATLEEGEMLDERALPKSLHGADRARAMTLAKQVMRWIGSADQMIDKFANTPPREDVRMILRIGVVELMVMEEAAFGVVDSLVSLADAGQHTTLASGFINAILRKVAKEGAPIWAKLNHARHSATEDGWRRMKTDWGKAGGLRILKAQLDDAPLDLTVKSDAADWATRLGGAVTPTGSVRLTRPGAVTSLEGYETGEWWVQDAAAALPARMAPPANGKVLDLCAAPGGKTMQLAAAGWDVTALDSSVPRMRRVEANLKRTGLTARLVTADALTWAEDTFDLVLLDAPCSATGTVRRHPELPSIRGEAEIATLSALQKKLLPAAWARVAQGGTLIYCVCSMTKTEGEDQAAAFLSATPDATHVPLQSDEFGDPDLVTEEGDLRTKPSLWPEIGGMDGFFAFRAQRSA